MFSSLFFVFHASKEKFARNKIHSSVRYIKFIHGKVLD